MNNTQSMPTGEQNTQLISTDKASQGALPETEIETALNNARKQPIPPPSEPRQYRAIGLIKGQYRPSEEQNTRGTLIAEDGTEIDAVILGRVISLLKNHLDLNQSYLWVVYPRTRQNDDKLHVQISGVWEPELLTPQEENSQLESENNGEERINTTLLEDGYFSIRGEAIYYSKENETLILKIQQLPRKKQKRQYFKIHLFGLLSSDRAVGHFWDIHGYRQGTKIIIQQARDLGIILKKKSQKRKGKGSFNDQRRPFREDSKGSRPEGYKTPLPSKPIKKPKNI